MWRLHQLETTLASRMGMICMNLAVLSSRPPSRPHRISRPEAASVTLYKDAKKSVIAPGTLDTSFEQPRLEPLLYCTLERPGGF